MEKLVKDLFEMKSEIDESKTDIAQHEGKKEVLSDRLKKDFDCDDLEEAEKKLEKLNKTIEKKENKLKTGIEKLKTDFGWED